MHLCWTKYALRTSFEAAFTLIEVMMGVALMGLLSASLYAGLSYGFAEISLSREEERATQILEERMEVVRLLNWDQVVNLPGFIPTYLHRLLFFGLIRPTRRRARCFIMERCW